MSHYGLLHKGSYRFASCLPLWPHVAPSLCSSCSVFQQHWPSLCFLNAPRLLYLLSFHLELFFLWFFLGGFLPSSLSHMSPPQRSLPKIPNLALPVLPPVITVTSLDILHATYHCQKLFLFTVFFFSLPDSNINSLRIGAFLFFFTIVSLSLVYSSCLINMLN